MRLWELPGVRSPMAIHSEIVNSNNPLPTMAWAPALALSPSAKTCFLRAVEVQYCGPLPLALGMPYYFAAEHAGDGLRRQIAVEIEVAAIQLLISRTETEGQVRRIVLGREDDPDRIAGERGSALDLRKGKVVDGDHGDGAAHVSQLRLGELVGDGPRGEDGLVGIPMDGLVDGLLLQPDGVGVAEVVVGREAVGRIDEQPETECEGGKRHQATPCRNAPPESCDADQKHQRIERKKIAREQRSAEHGEEQGVRNEDPDKRRDELPRQRRTRCAVRQRTYFPVRQWTGRQQQCRACA